MEKSPSYFAQSFLILVLSAVFFLGLKHILPDKIFSETTPLRSVVVDSMLINAFQTGDVSVSVTDSLSLILPEVPHGLFPEEAFEQYRGMQHLVPFFEKLRALESGREANVRIAYFGDSMTDGDMIVSDFRNRFQQRYGGQGVGFVPMTSVSAASRSSLTHEFSKTWTEISYLNRKYPPSPFGVSGHVFFAQDSTSAVWVSFKPPLKKSADLFNPTLFYGKPSQGNGHLFVVSGRDTTRFSLSGQGLVNKIVLPTTRKLKAHFEQASGVPLYGFNFDDGRGVHVDNFSQRGNSGIPLVNLSPAVMNAFQDEFGYDLIVLQYGTNVLSYGTKAYHWYERSMQKAVTNLRECFPNAAILVVSTADKASKYETQMRTDSAVIPLTKAQKRYAMQTQSAFVDLFTLMGGEGTMVKWVEETPAMANKDYTHFNFRGSKKIADLIYAHLDQGFAEYKTHLAKKKNTQP